MGTKTNPGAFDCYENALSDEPMFILLGRDPDFERLVTMWGQRRREQIRCGERPESDMPMVIEAERCAHEGAKWRRENKFKWRG